jgi:hypothetical protein
MRLRAVVGGRVGDNLALVATMVCENRVDTCHGKEWALKNIYLFISISLFVITDICFFLHSSHLLVIIGSASGNIRILDLFTHQVLRYV